MHILLTGNTAFKLTNFRAGLMKELLADGHSLSALVPRDHCFDKLRKFDVQAVELKMSRQSTSIVGELRLFARFWRKFRSLKPDLILGYTIKNNIYGALAARSLDIPFIPNVTGLGAAFESSGFINQTAVILYRAAFRDVPTAFFQNSHDRDLFEKVNIITKNRAILLPGSGVNLSHFTPAPLSNVDDAPTFLLVARMLRDKGIFEFVEAAKIVRSKYPMARFQLLGPLDLESHVAIEEDQIRAWHESGTVEYLGSADDVRPILKSADCIVLPSYYKEGTPRALIEGAAMGRPLITTDMPGCRDVVDNGRTGLICEAKNHHDLAEKMVTLVKLGHAGRSKMGWGGRLKILDEYDERIVIAAYRRAIGDILEARSVRC